MEKNGISDNDLNFCERCGERLPDEMIKEATEKKTHNVSCPVCGKKNEIVKKQ